MSSTVLNIVAAMHVFLCLLLICLVLLQDPKGGAAGGIFGGGGANSLLGATGATTFLAKFTRFTAIGFSALCLLMVWLLKQNTGSILDTIELPAGATTPPAATAPASPGETTGTATDSAPSNPSSNPPADKK